MASVTLSQQDISNGRRNIVQSLPNPTPYGVANTYTRPSDWTAIPTVSVSSYVAGIYAVYNQDINFVAITAGTDGNATNPGTIQGNVFSWGTLAGVIMTYPYVGSIVTGTGVTAGTVVTDIKSTLITGSATGTTLTVTAISGDPIVVGTVFTSNASDQQMRYVTGFLTGTGGVGTYTCTSTGTFSFTNNRAYTAYVNNSQTVNTLAAPASITVSSNYQVDWGDGSAVEIYATTTQAQHNYVYSSVPGAVSSRGYKTAAITITPVATLGPTWTTGPAINAINLGIKYTGGGFNIINNYASKWLDVKITLGNTSGAPNIYGTTGNPMLEQITIGAGTNPSSYANTFQLLKSLQSFIIDPSVRITSWSGAFNNSGLISGPSLSTTNTSTATDVSSMFSGCTNLQYIPPYDFSAATTMQTFALNCALLEKVDQLTTSALTTVNGAFQGCASLRSIAPFNTSNVTVFTSLFNGCVNLRYEAVPLLDTTKGITFTNMFNLCSSLVSVPLYNLSNATATNSMFSGCSSLVSVPLLNTANVTNMSGMFNGCAALQTIPLLNTIKVTDMSAMFTGTTGLITIPTLNTSNVTTLSTTFQNSGIQYLPNIDTTKVNNWSSMCNGAAKLTTIPSFNTSNATSMSGVFWGATSLYTIPLIDTSNVTDFSNMFNGAKMQTCPNLNTSNAGTVANMFISCTALSVAPTLDTAKVTNASGMFSGCTRLVSVPSYNFANNSIFTNIFNGCSNLVSVTMSAVNAGSSSTSTFQGAFTSCNSLNSINIPLNVFGINTPTNQLNFSSLPSLVSVQTLSNVKVGALNLNGSCFSKASLENIFANGIIANTTSYSINITSNPGTDAANAKTSGTTAGSNVITMANTVGIIAGQTFIYGTGVNTGIPVTFTDAGDTVAYTNGGVNGLANDDNVLFTAITTTTGISISTRYFVVNRTGTTFQVSSTQGGAPLALTNNGTGTMSIGGATISNKVVTVNANANVIINGVAGVTNAAASLTARNLNINHAVTKNWTITG